MSKVKKNLDTDKQKRSKDKEKLYKSWECFSTRIPHNRL